MSSNNKESEIKKIPVLITSENLKFLNDNNLSIAKTINILIQEYSKKYNFK